jgi:hypothetical protein
MDEHRVHSQMSGILAVESATCHTFRPIVDYHVMYCVDDISNVCLTRHYMFIKYIVRRHQWRGSLYLRAAR